MIWLDPVTIQFSQCVDDNNFVKKKKLILQKHPFVPHSFLHSLWRRSVSLYKVVLFFLNPPSWRLTYSSTWRDNTSNNSADLFTFYCKAKLSERKTKCTAPLAATGQAQLAPFRADTGMIKVVSTLDTHVDYLWHAMLLHYAYGAGVFTGARMFIIYLFFFSDTHSFFSSFATTTCRAN